MDFVVGLVITIVIFVCVGIVITTIHCYAAICRWLFRSQKTRRPQKIRTPTRRPQKTPGDSSHQAFQAEEMAATLSLKIAMAVAMSDGNLHKREGMAIKKAAIRLLSPYSGKEAQTMKQRCNQAIKESHAEAKQGSLHLESLARRLNNTGNQQLKHEALQLCTDVMTADGVADPSELALLHRIGDLIGLDMQQVKRFIDTGLMKKGLVIASAANPEDVFGVNPNWNSKHIKEHLRAEFRKWNSRMNTLSEGSERDNAQHMINMLGELKKKYG